MDQAALVGRERPLIKSRGVPGEMAQPHIVVFANEKGGTGKSTTAVHTAVALAASGHRVAALVASGRGAAAEAIERAATDVASREAWIALAECWVEPASARVQQVDGVGDLRVEVLNDDELSYARSRNAPVLDYRFLSTRAA